jgi:hypothetical protein
VKILNKERALKSTKITPAYKIIYAGVDQSAVLRSSVTVLHKASSNASLAMMSGGDRFMLEQCQCGWILEGCYLNHHL